MSGTSRLPSEGTPVPVCHFGLEKYWLAPPPEAERPAGGFSASDAVVSFQGSSGMYSSAVITTSFPVPEPAQYGLSGPAVVFVPVPVTAPAVSPVNSFPPAPVTSGMDAGTSTASPKVAEFPLSQS